MRNKFKYTKILAFGLLFSMVALPSFGQANVEVIGENDAKTSMNSTEEPRWEDVLRDKLKAIADEADRNYYTTGISVYDLTTDSLLFGYNQHKMMRPASTQKLLTAISALDILGKDHLYQTAVYLDTESVEIVDSLGRGGINGNIYIIGDFDPKLQVSDLKTIAKALKERNICFANGLIADLSMKDTLILGNGWCWDDEQPFLTPLSLSGSDYECTNVKINRYQPARRLLETAVAAFADDSIYINKGVGFGQYKPKAGRQPICVLTHSIEEVLQRMMKNSDNLYAESMFYQLAADTKKGIGWKDCAARVSEVIAKTGAPSQYAEVADGSGLSLYNYVTPSIEVAMLRYAYKHEKMFGTLYHSLPIAGVDGTIGNRMLTGKANRNVHAKTGTVTGVSCLAGYLTASNGHLVAFSIMNNGLKKVAEGKRFEDRICEIICE